MDLAPLASPSLVTRTVASVLGVVEGPRRSLEEALEQVLRERELLLMLDNCEHAIDACAELVERLLSACPRLRLIATSREPLGVWGEQLYPVAPLALPAEGEQDLQRLRTNDAARLLTERARLARPDFALTDENGGAVTMICRSLDGIPLALELAAARLRTMSINEIAASLDDRFGVLTSGRRTAPPRHRTLRGMVDWSWDLLRESEQLLLRRLAVFAGGWTGEAAEHVCAGDGLAANQITPLLRTLVDRSLVVMDDWRGSRRFRLLDTIRSYAGERLREAHEEAVVRTRHQDWYFRMIESSDREMLRDQQAWLHRMDAELGNIRVALDWCHAAPGSAERILRAPYGLYVYWDMRAHSEEACRRFEELLGLLPAGPPTPGLLIGRCFSISTRGAMGHLAEIIPLFQETRTLEHQVGDRAASFWLAWIELQYVALINDPDGPAVARARLAEQRAAPMPLGDSLLPWYYGIVLLRAGDLEAAGQVLQEAVETTELDHVRDVVTDFLGMVAFKRGDLEAAQRCFQQALAGFASLPNMRLCGIAVDHLADVYGVLGRWERAAWLLGASEMLLDLSNKVNLPFWQLQPEKTNADCRVALGEAAFASAFAAGRAITFEQAVAYALEDADTE